MVVCLERGANDLNVVQLMQLPLLQYTVYSRMVFTARRYASTVYAMVVCLSVCVRLSVCRKSEFY